MDEQLRNLIDSCYVISFDIFDTAIIRACKNPQKIFCILEQRLGSEYKGIKENRIKAEKTARRKSAKEEITLDDIYKELERYYPCKCDFIKKIEIEIELEQCRANAYIKNTYEYCLENNKKLYFTSDMYLSDEVVKKILLNAGYKKYDGLLLSSAYNKRKSTGVLYDELVKISGIEKRKILHIGDNIKSDYYMAKFKDLKAYHYNSIRDDFHILENLRNFIVKRLEGRKKVGFYYRFGYSILGPAIYGYVKWLERKLLEHKIHNVYFMAREGKFIKKAFDILKSNEFEEHYLYVSRRSLTVPAISTAKTLQDFLALRPTYDRVSIKNQISKIGLQLQDFADCSWINYIPLEKTFGDLSDNEKRVIQQDMFSKSLKHANIELVFLLDYLKQENFSGKLAVIDLGWNGSMQRALAQIAADNAISLDMQGFFLAQRDEYYKNALYIKNLGYLFNYNEVSKHENLLLNSGTNLLEFLFSADHGSTRFYRRKDDVIVPVLDEYEYSSVLEIITQCQEGAIDFIIDYKEKDWHDEYHEKIFFQPMYDVLKRPSKEVINRFGDICISDMDETDIRMAKKTPIFPVRTFVKSFQDAGWKVAFIKRNLRLKCAFELYAILREVFN